MFQASRAAYSYARFTLLLVTLAICFSFAGFMIAAYAMKEGVL